MKRSSFVSLVAVFSVGAMAAGAACSNSSPVVSGGGLDSGGEGDSATGNPDTSTTTSPDSGDASTGGNDATTDTGSPPADAGADTTAPADTGTDSPTDTGTDSPTDTGADTGSEDAGGTDAALDAASDAAPTYTLTIQNVDDWCKVSVNGGAFQTGTTITASSLPAGAVTLVAEKNGSFFVWPGMWYGTDQDEGDASAGVDDDAGGTEQSTATVTIGGDHCVSVCCGTDPAGGGCSDQCP